MRREEEEEEEERREEEEEDEEERRTASPKCTACSYLLKITNLYITHLATIHA